MQSTGNGFIIFITTPYLCNAIAPPDKDHLRSGYSAGSHQNGAADYCIAQYPLGIGADCFDRATPFLGRKNAVEFFTDSGFNLRSHEAKSEPDKTNHPIAW